MKTLKYLAITLALFVAFFSSSSAAADEAAEILETAGVHGGLVVHLGCGGGQLTAALHAGSGYLVNGLDTDMHNVQEARKYINGLGLYGPVAVAQFDGRNLPYIDNLVNLVVAEDLNAVPMKEVMRVLAPLGVACIKKDGAWTKKVKPWPADIDEWTHYLHGPDNNAVANDTVVAPPKGVQWVCGPIWSRAHSTLNGTTCMASARGRIFTIEDHAPTALPYMEGKYVLVARDGFNGVTLWEKPLKTWESIMHWMKPSPVQLTRRLVAVDDRVYVTLGIFAPVTELDAATGEVIKVYEGTEETQEILVSDGKLYVVTGDPMKPYGLTEKSPGYRSQYAVYGEENYAPLRMPAQHPRFNLMAVDATSGNVIWQHTGQQDEEYDATTLAVHGDMVAYQTKKALVRLNRADGSIVWKTTHPTFMEGDFKLGGSSPTLVLTDKVILRADNKNLIAFSTKDGSELWRTPTQATYFSSPDIFVVNGVVWPYPSLDGHDLMTGEVVATRRITRDGPMVHDRCYRNKATVNYMINSRSGGADFSEFDADFSLANPWVRSTCSLGVMPCNGLLYASPHACSCANEAKVNGFFALSAKSNGQQEDNPLVTGPAYDGLTNREVRATDEDWPSYRRTAMRSGTAGTTLPGRMAMLWSADVADPSAPVVAAGKVLVTNKDAHQLFCLDSNTGKVLWTFIAGGRLDSPPTYVSGRVLLGAADGWVYCLSADTGELAWRFRAAPNGKVTVGFGQVESLWPLHGSVLVLGDIAYVVAGRQSFLDGGLYLFGLDIATGSAKYQRHIEGPYGDDGESILDYEAGNKGTALVSGQVKGNQSDILVADDGLIYLRHMAFTPELSPVEEGKPHLETVSGFLDDTGHHRSYWTVSERLIYDTTLGDNIDADMLVMDGENLYGTRLRQSGRTPQVVDPYAGFSLFGMKQSERPPQKKNPRKPGAAKRGPANDEPTRHYEPTWEKKVPVIGKAMMKAGGALLVAGEPNEFPEDDLYRSVEGRAGGVLVATSVTDGQTIGEYKLDSPPVWDGMAAADNRLYICLSGGKVQCWGAE